MGCDGVADGMYSTFMETPGRSDIRISQIFTMPDPIAIRRLLACSFCCSSESVAWFSLSSGKVEVLLLFISCALVFVFLLQISSHQYPYTMPEDVFVYEQPRLENDLVALVPFDVCSLLLEQRSSNKEHE